ncbi:riboflavin synthase [Polynucleobacter sphagniphilus]|jgi:riboflavin synthase|uniref:Riboflavin synthase n=1 Tax=Polynucleobacter sphagniphilus TaxID=1743169 RepID=A0AA43M9C6_9BURK|nr:riboflavin synthase [Polynucleobacter sphagniphilus]MDF9787620.1 riboflavin synthase [Polynucleobacter sphagniphilus]MDH6154000.1 riboflavin synthase [Polynucleobacter sphagniphilus]MDH6240270.1 riboflavin synthase [Polynucleobacter sphagniphilus]MDH6248440.1 riboflavin synthase [Polynucleobacter sphagniphilus]MDH6298906.1 riboflavin synthase [Polynucleobacter sphagniphilus]
MFTGIITAVGKITSAQAKGDGMHLRVEVPDGYLSDVALGDSIAIQGACMTATQIEGNTFALDISAESLQKTVGLDALGGVNLEKALRLNDRLGGHLVSGHVDGVGTVAHFAAVAQDAYGSWLLRIEAPQTLAAFLAYKGSIVVNGVSLTVNKTEDTATACMVDINLIPHTLQSTTLGKLKQGDQVNLEIDLIARYVARMLETQAK